MSDAVVRYRVGVVCTLTGEHVIPTLAIPLEKLDESVGVLAFWKVSGVDAIQAVCDDTGKARRSNQWVLTAETAS